METGVSVFVVDEDSVSSTQKDEMLGLQIACFSDQVTSDELEEDFNRPPIARVLAYHQHELIACAEVFKRQVEYDKRAIVVGGMGPCTREDWRGQGVGTLVCKAAMNYLQDLGCDIVFLSVDTERKTYPLYERLGFKMLSKPFVYVNTRGEYKESTGGMIAPLCSPNLFEIILHGNNQFTLAPEVGYW